MAMINVAALFISLSILVSLLFVLQTNRETKILRRIESASELKSKATKQQHQNAPIPWTNHVSSLTKVLSNESDQIATPFFMHVQKSGGTTMKQLGACLGLTIADEHGQFSNQPASLDVLTWNNALRYVNIDACSISGLRTAHLLGFASQQPADAIYTSYFRIALEELFDDTHPASVFAVFRDPIDRATSSYYYLKHAAWEKTFRTEFRNMTFTDYVHNYAEDNYITRTIAGKTNDHANLPVTRDDFELAKLFLKDFVMIGLTDEMDESIVRFARVFGWDRSSNWKACRRRASQGSNRNDHPQVKPGDEEWDLLVAKNEYDLELFRYAQELFVGLVTVVVALNPLLSYLFDDA